MDIQYIVKCKNINERICFYNYLINNGFQPVEKFKHQNFINNTFPFVIEPNNMFWICESITCCAAASSCGAIISMEEYFNIIKEQETKKHVKSKKI